MTHLPSAKNSKNGDSLKTAVLGAGLSGLTTGYLLDEKGLYFEVLEENTQCWRSNENNPK